MKGMGRLFWKFFLAIARRAIETHGGTMRARNRSGGGLTVEIVLPTAAAG